MSLLKQGDVYQAAEEQWGKRLAKRFAEIRPAAWSEKTTCACLYPVQNKATCTWGGLLSDKLRDGMRLLPLEDPMIVVSASDQVKQLWQDFKQDAEQRYSKCAKWDRRRHMAYELGFLSIIIETILIFAFAGREAIQTALGVCVLCTMAALTLASLEMFDFKDERLRQFLTQLELAWKPQFGQAGLNLQRRIKENWVLTSPPKSRGKSRAICCPSYAHVTAQWIEVSYSGGRPRRDPDSEDAYGVGGFAEDCISWVFVGVAISIFLAGVAGCIAFPTNLGSVEAFLKEVQGTCTFGVAATEPLPSFPLSQSARSLLRYRCVKEVYTYREREASTYAKAKQWDHWRLSYDDVHYEPDDSGAGTSQCSMTWPNLNAPDVWQGTFRDESKCDLEARNNGRLQHPCHKEKDSASGICISGTTGPEVFALFAWSLLSIIIIIIAALRCLKFCCWIQCDVDLNYTRMIFGISSETDDEIAHKGAQDFDGDQSDQEEIRMEADKEERDREKDDLDMITNQIPLEEGNLEGQPSEEQADGPTKRIKKKRKARTKSSHKGRADGDEHTDPTEGLVVGKSASG